MISRTTDQERQLFEHEMAIIFTHTDFEVTPEGHYENPITGTWLLIWQAARRAQAQVPPGWKLVPVIPTMDMIAAGNRKRQAAAWLTSGINAVPATYKAMVDAAPKPR